MRYSKLPRVYNLNKEDYGRSYSLFFSEVKSDLIIRVGDLNNKEPDSDEEEFEVEEIFMHEGYDSKYYFLKDKLHFYT